MRALMLGLLLAAVTSAADPVPVMLLDGESGGPYHKWQIITPVLKKQLEETGLFQTHSTSNWLLKTCWDLQQTFLWHHFQNRLSKSIR